MTTNEADVDLLYERLTMLLNNDRNWSQDLSKALKMRLKRRAKGIQDKYNGGELFVSDFADNNKLTMKNKRLARKSLQLNYEMKKCYQEFTEYELRVALCEILAKNLTFPNIEELYGITKNTFTRYLKKCTARVCDQMNISATNRSKKLKDMYINNSSFKVQWDYVASNITKKDLGRPTACSKQDLTVVESLWEMKNNNMLTSCNSANDY